MMDFTGVYEHFVGIVVLACLMIGYAIKHWSLLKRVPNDDIPIILACLFFCQKRLTLFAICPIASAPESSAVKFLAKKPLDLP